MKKGMLKRIISLLLCLIMLVGYVPLVGHAAQIPEGDLLADQGKLSATWTNPLYRGIRKTESNPAKSNAAYASSSTVYKDMAAAGEALKAQLLKRTYYTSFYYRIPAADLYADWLQIVEDIFNEAVKHNGVPNEGDYLMYHTIFLTYGVDSAYYTTDGKYIDLEVFFEADMASTYEQEKTVNSKVNSLLASLNPKGTDYQKIKLVYDWMCHNIVYDYTNVNYENYLPMYGAYAALVQKVAVCQGYANLFYRLALEMGVDCRLIAGLGNGGPHAWNIVKINGKYYNLDSTWDAEISPYGDNYMYFLKSSQNFPGHVRDSEYSNSSFNSKYPMATSDFNPAKDTTGTLKITAQPSNAYAANGATVKTTVKASGTGLKYRWYYRSASSGMFIKSSQNTATYSTTMNSSRNGYKVYCVVSDANGNRVTTKTVTLTMRNPLKITTQPTNKTAANGATVSTKVVASGDGLKYQWYYTANGKSSTFVKSGTTSATYSTTMNADRDGRKVYCVITDKYGNSVKTNTVTLSMKKTAKITTQPVSKTVADGAAVSVKVVASGDGLKYQWYFKAAGASSYTKSSTTTATYSTTMNAARDGYKIYCVITDKYGNSVKSNTVTLSMK